MAAEANKEPDCVAVPESEVREVDVQGNETSNCDPLNPVAFTGTVSPFRNVAELRPEKMTSIPAVNVFVAVMVTLVPSDDHAVIVAVRTEALFAASDGLIHGIPSPELTTLSGMTVTEFPDPRFMLA